MDGVALGLSLKFLAAILASKRAAAGSPYALIFSSFGKELISDGAPYPPSPTGLETDRPDP